jgi:hypothetical protein
MPLANAQFCSIPYMSKEVKQSLQQTTYLQYQYVFAKIRCLYFPKLDKDLQALLS